MAASNKDVDSRKKIYDVNKVVGKIDAILKKEKPENDDVTYILRVLSNRRKENFALNQRIVKMLVERQKVSNIPVIVLARAIKDTTFMAKDASGGTVTVATALLDAGVIPNLPKPDSFVLYGRDQSTPLYQAIVEGWGLDYVKKLVEKNADMWYITEDKLPLTSVAIRYMRPKHHRSKDSDSDEDETLEKDDFDGDVNFRKANKEHHTTVLKYLLKYIRAVYPEENVRGSPVFVAAEESEKDAMYALKGYTTDFSPIDENGYTPMHVAVIKWSKGVVKALLELGANPDIKDEDGDTPLDIARNSGYWEIKKVISKWKKKNASSSNPQSIVHAVKVGNANAIKDMLREDPALASVVTGTGKTLKQYADSLGYTQIASLFE